MTAPALHRRAFRRHTIRILFPLIECLPAVYLGIFALALGPDDSSAAHNLSGRVI